jgi:hypothetical protein
MTARNFIFYQNMYFYKLKIDLSKDFFEKNFV